MDNTKRENFLAKCLHIECTEEDRSDLCDAMRKWIKEGEDSLKFGQHIKLIQELRQDTPLQKIDCTIRINAHGC